MSQKRPWVSVGVFGLAARIINGEVCIMVNERTDQERQWKAANLEPIPGVAMVDCPGGGIKLEDFESLKKDGLAFALRREVKEESGVEIEITGPFSAPLFVATDKDNPEKPMGDIAVWAPIKLLGEPQPSNEAKSHPWLSRTLFDAETPYRCVSGLGKAGRTGQMMAAALQYYQTYRQLAYLFS